MVSKPSRSDLIKAISFSATLPNLVDRPGNNTRGKPLLRGSPTIPLRSRRRSVPMWLRLFADVWSICSSLPCDPFSRALS